MVRAWGWSTESDTESETSLDLEESDAEDDLDVMNEAKPMTTLLSSRCASTTPGVALGKQRSASEKRHVECSETQQVLDQWPTRSATQLPPANVGDGLGVVAREAPQPIRCAGVRRDLPSVPGRDFITRLAAFFRGGNAREVGETDGKQAWGSSLPLPACATQWSKLERSLFLETAGRYDPSEMAALRRCPSAPAAQGADPGRCRVSVVTPTTDTRAHFHEQLWSCFTEQRWSDKELLIIETYTTTPSTCLAEKARRHENVIHISIQGDLSIGLKRNIGLHLASGDVIVNFDDDDIYSPDYVPSMTEHLYANNLAALTLSTWFDFDLRRGQCGFVDPMSLQDESVEEDVWGYGFSYVHLRQPALANPYPSISFGEDYDFMLALREALGASSIGLLSDTRGLCLHMMHGGNTADSAKHRKVTAQEMRHLAVAKLSLVSPLLDICQRNEHRVSSGKCTGKFTINTTKRCKNYC